MDKQSFLTDPAMVRVNGESYLYDTDTQLIVNDEREPVAHIDLYPIYTSDSGIEITAIPSKETLIIDVSMYDNVEQVIAAYLKFTTDATLRTLTHPMPEVGRIQRDYVNFRHRSTLATFRSGFTVESLRRTNAVPVADAIVIVKGSVSGVLYVAESLNDALLVAARLSNGYDVPKVTAQYAG